MSKSLNIILKLGQRELDDKRQELAEAQKRKENLQMALDKLRRELEEEGRLMQLEPKISHIYSYYAERNLTRQNKIAQEINNLDSNIALLTEEIFDLFTKAKKYEIVLNQKRQKKIRQYNQQVGREFDELSVAKYSVPKIYEEDNKYS